MRRYIGLIVLAFVPLAATAISDAAQQPRAGFFVTSAGSGNGGDLGGLAGADKRCQTLAMATGQGSRTWRAYLSTTGAGSVNARDRVGKGPWYNVKGVMVARALTTCTPTRRTSTTTPRSTNRAGRSIPGAPNRPAPRRARPRQAWPRT